MASVSFYSEIARPQLFADSRRHQLLSAMDYLYSAALHATHTREILNVTVVDSTGGGPVFLFDRYLLLSINGLIVLTSVITQ